ncbi:outer membrane beta-barrel family protein [Mucilaginibacter sp. KACC 22773]|uniref:outer membrane beta-barrel family protein n=1 Tax=Mucilaginibacter sp. KACC 22773 TaxID=3025671 RepID=UPI002365F6F3|nr:outer membrane beta-barrel family protein [Mucilaginibacter sp. KACC 22773]WDF81388.1 outer membrane beta-barrel family protein [Mucilaginibacter sp. KACC 22773]
MKKTLLCLFILTFAAIGYAQNRRGGGNGNGNSGAGNFGKQRGTKDQKGPLPFREVYGVVKDTANKKLEGATIKLISATDSMVTSTGPTGKFRFGKVKSATFVITVTSVGFQTVVRKMLNNDESRSLELDAFVLKPQQHMLGEVVINGEPSVTYKTDTVEYRASDYKVRPNATVDELIKKMEGVEVAKDGTVTHQGQAVVKARLNGKDYIGGDVAQAIKNLPADIVDKVQIIDDYGDQAARTGIKDGDPQKVLNITTRADRSVGNVGRLSAGAGSDDRYDNRLFFQRINGNEQIGVIGSFVNTVNGVSGGTGGGSGGTTKTGGPNISYRSYLTKKIQINTSYNYNFRDVNSINHSDGQQFSTLGTTNFIRNSNSQNNNKTHNVNLELEYNIDSANYLKVTPSFSYSGVNSTNTSQSFKTGLIHQDILGLTGSNNTVPTWGAIVFYQHLFKKPKRNLSLQVSYNRADNETVNEQDNNIIYYQDSTNHVLKDSLVNRHISRSNLSKNFRTSFTYVEPLTDVSQLEFNAQVNSRSYDNQAYTYNIDSLGRRSLVDSLSNVFKYSFTETRLALNYRINQKKYNVSIGVTGVPTVLDGTKVTGGVVSTHRTNFNLIPIVRFQYVWSKQERFSVNYSGSPQEPSFNQIQPVRDESNPQNPVVGNPDLKPSFRNSINLQYNNYIVDSKFNVSANANVSFIKNQIVTNTVQIADTLGALKNETHYINLNGSYTIGGNYNISKQLDNRKYNLSLNGTINYGHGVSMSNNVQNFTTTWHFNERLGPQINPSESVEINPYVSYDVAKSYFTLPHSVNTNISTTALAIDGKFYFLTGRTATFGYNANKNFVKGISQNLTRNPLVINAYIEQQFFKRRNLTLTFQVFDILKQNNFVNQVTTENSVTNTLSNAQSRYFMFSAKLNLQKWTGSPMRHGQRMKRRGDGSFIE